MADRTFWFPNLETIVHPDFIHDVTHGNPRGDHVNKDDIKRVTQNPAHIPGIYNYCDRWCERCTFTRRCANFAIGELQEIDNDELDIRNEGFWKTFQDTMQATLELVSEMAEEAGVHLGEIDVEEAERDEKENEAERSPIGIASMAYIRLVDTSLEEARDRFSERGEELELFARTDPEGFDPEGHLADLKDAVDIIRWYQHQIYVKMMRAIQGKEDPWEEDEGFPKDSDGSAKVALIGIDRSITAWTRMWRGHFPDEEDAFLPLLLHLDRLRRRIETDFPNARSFVRVGFDDAGV